MSYTAEGMDLAAMTVRRSSDPIMTGFEEYPIIKTSEADRSIAAFLKKEIKPIITSFKGLKMHSDCLQKAQLVKKHLHWMHLDIIIGSLYVTSITGQSEYGYEYNLPYEFHAWIRTDSDRFIDFALPGVILNGLSLSDDQGPFLEGRVPGILIGYPPSWLRYNQVSIFA